MAPRAEVIRASHRKNHESPAGSPAGFSLVELLITLALLIVISTLYFGFSSPQRQRTAKQNCQVNLRKLFLAQEIYAHDNAGKFPVVAGAKAGCDDIEKIAWARVQSKNGPLTIVAVHLNWPWPWNYAGRQRRIQRILSELPQPTVIAGDFNMVPWAVALQRLQGRTGTGWVGPMRFSFRPNGLQVLLPIDQVLVPKGFEGRTKLVPGLGSDHYGLWVRVGRRTPPP